MVSPTCSPARPLTALRLAPRAAALLLAAATLGGCNALSRLSEVGDAPATSRIQDPTKAPDYQPVSLPMPTPIPPTAGANSLWRPGARGFFKDQRASEIGDILTVTVSITNNATMQNETTTKRDNGETLGSSSSPLALFGIPASLGKIFSGTNTSQPVNVASTSKTDGSGTLTRQEQITVNLAAVITQRLPNGNLVITGKQELRVNNELREVSVTGVIRPEDITSSNNITSDKIAEARITYGGRGSVSDVQQPRYGQQIFDIISPF